jgi:hypothetical protein
MEMVAGPWPAGVEVRVGGDDAAHAKASTTSLSGFALSALNLWKD